MDINQLRTTLDFARKNRTACSLVPGMGYMRLGDPVFPDKPINPPAACTPPDDAPDMSLHQFKRPGDEQPSVSMHWLADDRLWQPLSALTGNRMAFRPAYLAAHGWKLANG